MHAVCSVPVSPLRSEPSHKAEMISQLLFGEAGLKMESGPEKWIKVQCLYDGYEGWTTTQHVVEITESMAIEPAHLSSDWSNEIVFNNLVMRCPFGSDLRGLKNGQAEWSKYNWSYKGNHIDPQHSRRTEKNFIKIANIFLNTPYLWGGRSVFGVDCSGFTQIVYKSFGLPLKRDAYQQAGEGESVGFLQEAACGDLAFFDNEEGKIVHTGILINDHEIIHSSGKVRIDKIDSGGIINTDTGERTHRLRLIKKYF